MQVRPDGQDLSWRLFQATLALTRFRGHLITGKQGASRNSPAMRTTSAPICSAIRVAGPGTSSALDRVGAADVAVGSIYPHFGGKAGSTHPSGRSSIDFDKRYSEDGFDNGSGSLDRRGRFLRAQCRGK